MPDCNKCKTTRKLPFKPEITKFTRMLANICTLSKMCFYKPQIRIQPITSVLAYLTGYGLGILGKSDEIWQF